MASTITVSFSEIDTFRQCPFKHELSYKERWVSPGSKPALARGTAWHSMSETHYEAIQSRRGDSPSMAWQEAQLAAFRKLAEMNLPDEEEQLLRWMYVGYIDRWEGEDWGIKPGTRVMAVEYGPVVWLPTERGGRSRFRLKLKVDLVVMIDGKIWIVDHKTGKDLPKDKELDIDDQFGLYTWAMRQIGKPVFGSIHNAVRTQRNKDQARHPQPLDERFSRKRLYRTDTELTNLAVDAYRAARRAYAIKPGEADRAPNTDTCKWKCDYTEACLAGRKGMDDRDMLRSMQFRQDFERH